MYNAKYVVIGIIILLGIISTPFLYNLASGETTPPELEKPKGDHCIESEQWMAENHMELLKEWRTMKIREGKATYVSKEYGEVYELSFAQCFECHTKSKFCDECHEYTGVSQYCFTFCHKGLGAGKE